MLIDTCVFHSKMVNDVSDVRARERVASWFTETWNEESRYRISLTAIDD